MPLGKLQLTEGAFSVHHPDIEPPVNPWNEALWPGVSSSGSGVAVAAGLCFGALGTDTLGSIRFPSTVNGVTGLKPTRGRVSRAGVFPLAETLDHVGPMARSAIDAAALLGAIAGPDDDDPTAARDPVPDYLAAIGAGVRGLRIGIDRELIAAGSDPDMQRICAQAAVMFAGLGAHLVASSLPPLEPAAADAMQLCAAQAAAAHAATWPARADEYGPALAGLIEAGHRVEGLEMARIAARRELFTGRLDALFEGLDLLLVPAMDRAAPTLEQLAQHVTEPAARLARALHRALRPERQPDPDPARRPGGRGLAGRLPDRGAPAGRGAGARSRARLPAGHRLAPSAAARTGGWALSGGLWRIRDRRGGGIQPATPTPAASAAARSASSCVAIGSCRRKASAR